MLGFRHDRGNGMLLLLLETFKSEDVKETGEV
jgi:hypothetical protein